MAWKYSYEQLLDKAYSELPEVSEETVRFEIPTVKGGMQGNRTVISNLSQIAAALRRPEAHLYKFFLRELATTGDQKKGQTVFVGRFRSAFLNAKIEKYVNEFVYCKQCKKPDTHLTKEQGVTLLVCEACGAKSTVRTLK
jgi:translation initiation factor 2 subunit 2